MSIDLGLVHVLGADAVGQPGQRRFRLFAQSARGAALMWLEKQQLDSLAVVLDRSLALITEGQVLRTEARPGETSGVETLPVDFPPTPDYEIQVAQMRLGFNEEDVNFQLFVVPGEIVQGRGEELEVQTREDEAISVIFTQQQAQHLSQAIVRLLAAGRPVCPLCGTPLDGTPHACVKQNGHREILQIEQEGEN